MLYASAASQFDNPPGGIYSCVCVFCVFIVMYQRQVVSVLKRIFYHQRGKKGERVKIARKKREKRGAREKGRKEEREGERWRKRERERGERERQTKSKPHIKKQQVKT